MALFVNSGAVDGSVRGPAAGGRGPIVAAVRAVSSVAVCGVLAVVHVWVMYVVAGLGNGHAGAALAGAALGGCAVAVFVPGAWRRGWSRWVALSLIPYVVYVELAPVVLVGFDTWVLWRFLVADRPVWADWVVGVRERVGVGRG